MICKDDMLECTEDSDCGGGKRCHKGGYIRGFKQFLPKFSKNKFEKKGMGKCILIQPIKAIGRRIPMENTALVTRLTGRSMDTETIGNFSTAAGIKHSGGGNKID